MTSRRAGENSMDNAKSDVDPCYESGLYEIRIQGQINEKRLGLFEDLTIEVGEDLTIIRGPLSDQTALHSILTRIRDMNLTLISVQQIEGGEPERPRI